MHLSTKQDKTFVSANLTNWEDTKARAISDSRNTRNTEKYGNYQRYRAWPKISVRFEKKKQKKKTNISGMHVLNRKK